MLSYSMKVIVSFSSPVRQGMGDHLEFSLEAAITHEFQLHFDNPADPYTAAVFSYAI